MEVSVITEMISHLEFLGYEITKKEGEPPMFYLRHSDRTSIVISEDYPGYSFRTFMSVRAEVKNRHSKYLEFINQLNSRSIVARFHYRENLNLVASSWFPNNYEKTTFGRFMDCWNNDTTEMIAEIGSSKEFSESLFPYIERDFNLKDR